jgi:hypothetical protein
VAPELPEGLRGPLVPAEVSEALVTKFQTIPEASRLHCAVSPLHFFASVSILGKPFCWICAGEIIGVKPEVAVKLYKSRTRSVTIKVPEDLDQVIVRNRVERMMR